MFSPLVAGIFFGTKNFIKKRHRQALEIEPNSQLVL